MIKAIIFDCVGVFTEKGLDKALDIVSKEFGFDREKLEIEYKKLAKIANLGEITANEVFQTLITKFHVNTTVSEMRKVWIDCYGEYPNPLVYDYAKELSKEYSICLFSNYSDAFDDLNKKLQLEKVFKSNKIFVSSKMKMKKPNKNAYNYVLGKIGFTAKETVLIDDREDNFKEAYELGMHGVLFRDIDQLKTDFDKLVNDKH